MENTKGINNFINMTQEILNSAFENLSHPEYIYFMAKIEATGTEVLNKIGKHSKQEKQAVQISRQAEKEARN